MGADSGLSAIHKDDLLHLREVVQAVRDEKDDLILGIFLQVGKDRILRVPVEGRERVIEDEDRARMGHRPGQCQTLGLSAGKTGAAAADDGIEAVLHRQHLAFQRSSGEIGHSVLLAAAEDIVLHRVGAQLRVVAQIADGGRNLTRGQRGELLSAKLCRAFIGGLADGLIEGASEGIGLGHDFLRHVERCRLLLHVVDVSGSECREPVEDFEKINEELAKFSPELAQRPQIVVGNKCDLATEEQIESFRSYVEGKGLTFVPISAATMQGVRELPGLVYNRLKDIPPVPVFTPEYKKPEPKANDRAYTIQRLEAHVWSIDAPWLEYILAGSNVDDYESLQYFQRQLDESGILTELVEKGVQENDTILIGEYQFDYIF